MEVELDSDSSVVQEHMDAAIRFDVDLHNLSNPVEAKKYPLAFIQKLFLQREKIDLELLTDYVQSGTVSLWKEVLSTLENSKLLGVTSGSLIFTLFCPTISSARELKDDSWIKTLSQKMQQLTNNIGQCNTSMKLSL